MIRNGRIGWSEFEGESSDASGGVDAVGEGGRAQEEDIAVRFGKACFKALG